MATFSRVRISVATYTSPNVLQKEKKIFNYSKTKLVCLTRVLSLSLSSSLSHIHSLLLTFLLSLSLSLSLTLSLYVCIREEWDMSCHVVLPFADLFDINEEFRGILLFNQLIEISFWDILSLWKRSGQMWCRNRYFVCQPETQSTFNS
jgi:hypothetical protein